LLGQQQQEQQQDPAEQQQGRAGPKVLESPTAAEPPVRSIDVGGYTAPAHLRTWPAFTYASPQARRDAVRAYARTLPPMPSLRIVLVGGPSVGKGTIAPMISQAFRVRAVGVGQLLRGEVRARTERGCRVGSLMACGALLPDGEVLSLLREKLQPSWDLARNGYSDGWLLDGFPRTEEQARALVSEQACGELRPDAVIVLNRPDELAREIALGRYVDASTGQTFHPLYAPPPDEVCARTLTLVWRRAGVV
jgi:adenylate kinase